MSQNTICLDTELRKLRPAELYTLGQILNISDSWKKLMAIIPKDDTSDVPKFNAGHFSMIEQATQQQRRNAADIFLAEWGTMGKNRPTLRILLKFLVEAELFRAADYVAGDILKEELPERPKCGPAAPVDVSEEFIRKLLENRIEEQGTDFNESLIFGLASDANDDKMICPNAMNVMIDNSLERNLQSTKLISTKTDHDEEYLKTEVSDLMKFSTDQHNIQECRTHYNACASIETVNTQNVNILEKQEMSSRELPVFLNEFKGATDQTQLNQEVLSDELPVVLNNSLVILNNDLHENFMSESSYLSHLSFNQNEIASTELPQCIVEHGVNSNTNLDKNNESIVKSALNSQELPITVLEYNN